MVHNGPVQEGVRVARAAQVVLSRQVQLMHAAQMLAHHEELAWRNCTWSTMGQSGKASVLQRLRR